MAPSVAAAMAAPALAPAVALAAPAVAHQRQVLILNAYDPTYEWTANIVRGARSVFDSHDDVDLSIEYMDTKKILTPAYAAELSDMYAQKYRGMHFDLILSSDDDALDFLKTYRDQLFPGVPVVFCGVNDLRDERIAGFSNATGVNEESDLDTSFAWVARLRPSTKRLVFVVDNSATSAAATRQINLATPRWRQRFAISFISDVTVGQLEDKLRRLPQDAVVFWEMFMRDRDDRPLSMAESHRRVVAASPVPVFGFTDVSVSLGAAGGYVLSGFAQGETAARMGMQILAGTPAAQIPVVRHSPNVYMVNYPEFVRWHLDTEDLPPGAVVNDRPFSFYERYHRYVWGMFGGMGAETLAILALLGAMRQLTRKSRAWLREGEARYRSIVEDGSELIGRFDAAGNVIFVNGALARFARQSASTLLGRSFWSLLPMPTDAVQSASQADIAALMPDHAIICIEQPYQVDAHEARWVLWTYRGLFGDDGTLTEVQAVGHDITDRRAAEQAVREALLKVKEGNVELGRANRNLQGVLDSMKEGLLVCDRHGVVGAIRSRAVMEWFGAPAPGIRVWDFLFDVDGQDKLRFQVAFEQIAEDILPFELNSDQLPRALRRGDTTYAMSCRQVNRDGEFVEIMFTLVDVTRQLEQDRVERLNREQPTIVGNLLRDREGFQEFADGAAEMLVKLGVTTDRDERKRLLHTLKGNTAVYGFDSFATQCNALEESMEIDEDEPSPARIGLLTHEWRTALGAVRVFLADDGQGSLRLGRADYEDLVHRLERRDDHAHVLHAVRQWNHPPMSQVLAIHARTVRQLAARLHKEIEAEIRDHGLRLPFDELRSFLGVLVHVIRNASDHGIETATQREKAGKSRVGHICIESRLEGSDFVIAVEDDGQGVDWDAVRRRAAKRSLPAANIEDLTEALFSSGLSTRDLATELSGRGVGLGAVRQACRQLGGTVRLTSERGRSTRIEFHFPLPFTVPSVAFGRATQLS